MSEERFSGSLAAAVESIEGARQVHGVPRRDGGNDEVQGAGPMFLAFKAPISDATEAMKADGARQGVFRLALIQLDRRLAPQDRVVEPVECKQGPLDATDLAQGEREPVLARIGAQSLQHQ